jgi:hypothetical protein
MISSMARTNHFTAPGRHLPTHGAPSARAERVSQPQLPLTPVTAPSLHGGVEGSVHRRVCRPAAMRELRRHRLVRQVE